VRRPQSNGFIERLHRTLLDEPFRIKGRTTWYESVGKMQTDLDSYLKHYNTQQPTATSGPNDGRTAPLQYIQEGSEIYIERARTKVT
jgi:transposase InsO family protein